MTALYKSFNENPKTEILKKINYGKISTKQLYFYQQTVQSCKLL